MELFITLIYRAPYNLLRLRSQYCPQCRLLKHSAFSAMIIGDPAEIRILGPQNTSSESHGSKILLVTRNFRSVIVETTCFVPLLDFSP